VTQTKDYRKGATRRPTRRRGVPAWIWGVLGVIGGLSVAAVYLHIKNRPATEVATSKAHRREPLSVNDIPDADPGPAGGYTYDEALKKNRVEIPEKSTEPAKESRPVPEVHPGTYVLQIASYKTVADAERQRAIVNMIGVEAKIQTVKINDQLYYRVRVGPFKSLDDLNRTQSRLQRAEIPATKTRLSD